MPPISTHTHTHTHTYTYTNIYMYIHVCTCSSDHSVTELIANGTDEENTYSIEEYEP